MKRLLILLASLIPVLLFAQTGSEVNVSLTIPPPYSPYFSDYSDLIDNGIITISNLTADQHSLKIIGYIESDNGLSASTSPNYQPPVPIVLNPFETRVIIANQQNQEFLDATNIDTNVDDALLFNIAQSGLLPEGNYEICIQAVDYFSGLPLSPDAPAGCSFFPIIHAQPPFLTAPFCDDSVMVTNNILPFSWMPVSANTPMPILYDLYVVPFFAGQNPNDAINGAISFGAGNPIIKLNLIATNTITLPSDLPLQANTWYAWCVVAHDPSQTIWIENNGRSEVCTFYVSSPFSPDEVTTYSSPPGPTDIVLPDYQLPPMALVNGNLKYRFHGDNVGTVFSPSSIGGFIPNFDNWYSGNGSGSAGAIGSSSGSSSGITYDGIDPTAVSDVLENIDIFGWNETPPPAYVLPNGYSAAGGLPLRQTNIVFTARYAIGLSSEINSVDDLQIIYPEGTPNVQLVSAESGITPLGPVNQQVGATTTDNDGNFFVSINMLEPYGLLQSGAVSIQNGSGEFVNTYTGNGLYRLVTMEINDPRYCHPDAYLFPQSSEALQLPQQVVVVKSYNLNVEVESNTLAEQAAGTQNEIEGVVVRLGRLASTYNNFPPNYPQGESRMTEFGYSITDNFTGPNVYLCDSAVTGGNGIVSFKRLVRSLGPCNEGQSGMNVYSTQNDGYFIEAFTHPYIGNYNYNKKTLWNLAPCPGGPNEFFLDDPLMRSHNYTPPTHEISLVLVPKDPEIYVNTRSDYGLGPEELPHVNLLFEIQKPNSPITWAVLQTDGNGLLKKQIGPADYYNGFAWKGMNGLFNTGYKIFPIKSGYISSSCNCTGINGAFKNLVMGERWNVDALLAPKGRVRGVVRDEDGNVVQGEVKIGDGVFLPLEVALTYVPSDNEPAVLPDPEPVTSGGSSGGLIYNPPVFYPLPGGLGALGGGSGSGSIPTTTGDYSYNGDPIITNIPIGDDEGGSVLSSGAVADLEFMMTTESLFDYPAQSGTNIPIIIRPYATSLFQDTFYVDIPVSTAATDLGLFILKKKLHRPVVHVKSSAAAIAATPIPNAQVILSDFDPVLTNSQGIASFLFPSPANEFRLQVIKEGMAVYDEHVIIPVTKEPYNLDVFLQIGYSISGLVTDAENGTPIAGARIHSVIGANAYGDITVETISDSNGAYTLSGLTWGNAQVWAGYADEAITYISGQQTSSIPSNSAVNFALNKAPFHMPEIWNMPAEISSFTPSGEGWMVSGSLHDLPSNERFRTEKENQRLHFANVPVVASGAGSNAGGQVLATPSVNDINLAETQFRAILNEQHVMNLTGAPGSGGIMQPVHPLLPPIALNELKLVKNEETNNGELRVKAFVMLEAFRTAYQYNSHFYLGESPASANIAAFKGAADEQMPESYYLMDLAPFLQTAQNPEYMVHDFQAYADRNQSYLRADSLILETRLVIDLPQSNPDELLVDAGKIVILPNEIQIFPGDTPMEFDLETWKVTTNSWTFSAAHGGILTSGIIRTNIFDIEAPTIILRPNELILPGAQAFSLDAMTLGGIANVDFKEGTNLSFGYYQAPPHDPESAHWRMALFNPDEVVGSIEGMPGWNPETKLDFLYTENFSDGYLDFTIAPEQYINHYNVINQWVSNLTINPDGFTLNGSVDLGIPNLSPGYSLNMVYYKAGSEIKVRPNGLFTSFETYGQVFFNGDQQSQRIGLDWNLLTVPGWLTIYDDTTPNAIQLRAMLTKTPSEVKLDIMKVDNGGLLAGNNFQFIQLGGGNSGKQKVLEGTQLVAAEEWQALGYLAQFEGFTGSMESGNDKMWFTVAGAIYNDNSKPESITLTNIPTPFGDFTLNYLLSTMEIVGTLNVQNIPFGTIMINEGHAQMLFGGRGFYMLAALDATYPVVGTLQTNLITGWYPEITPEAEQLLKEGMYLRRIPNFMENGGIHGLYVCANKTLVNENWEVNLVLFAAGLYINTGMDVQFWVNFSDDAGGAHIGGLAYFEMELYASVLGICEACFGLLAEVGISADIVWNPSTDFSATVCGTLGVNMAMCGESVAESAKAVGTISSSNGISISLQRGQSCGNPLSPGSNGCIHF